MHRGPCDACKTLKHYSFLFLEETSKLLYRASESLSRLFASHPLESSTLPFLFVLHMYTFAVALLGFRSMLEIAAILPSNGVWVSEMTEYPQRTCHKCWRQIVQGSVVKLIVLRPICAEVIDKEL